ncbi:restriction endonuclease subunit S [Enterococcus faecium]|uniref:restriction endonuclease subunit S n=1 Tax=Enterococcus faecium TaxID=1352 RepID=UPI0022E9637A|nr:restriction endonuclease subunit S [Enterococcus faecium]
MSNDTRPEIRFPGFTEDWEQRKLGELAESFEYGLNASAKKFDGSNKYIRITDIDDISHKFNQSGVTSPDIDFASADNYKLKKGDILFARTGASVGKTYMYRESDGLVYYAGFLIRARIKSKISSEFVFQTTFTDSYNRFIKITSQRSGQPGVNAEEYSNFKIMIPNYEEQNAIGCFFKKIDDTITLHQRKLDLLKETKKGFLQKMFPKNGAKVPEIRFPGFTEDWEQRKLGEVVERVTRKNKKLESIRPLTISAQEGLIDQNEFFNKTVASRDVSGYYLVKKGEFAYNKSYSNGYPWGAVKRLNQYDMGVLSTLYIVFKPKKIDSDFLEKYYDTTYWYKEVSKHAAEGARNHGLLNIAASDFFETEIVMPLKIEEQQKIGNFFKQLDDTIALHQRKLDVLKETKKGFLQKMFV